MSDPNPIESPSAEGADPEAPSTTSTDSAGESVTKRALQGTLITVGGNVASNLLRVSSNIILTRLLFPEAFGVVALVLVVIQGMEMLSDIGLLPNIVQSKRGKDPAFLKTAFTMQAIRGTGLAMVGAALAYPVSVFFEQPDLAWLIPVASLTSLLHGFSSVKIATNTRDINLARIVIMEVSAQASALIVMVIYALIHPSVWALIVGMLAREVVYVSCSHLLLKGHRDGFAWEKPAVRELFSFGMWIFLSTFITYGSMSYDRLYLGKLIPIDMLGVYGIAALLSQFPLILGGRVLDSVLLPALSESARENHEAMVKRFFEARHIVMAVSLVMVLGPALLGPAFFYILYDDRYHDAGWMVQFLMLWQYYQLLDQTYMKPLLATGRPQTLFVTNTVKLIATIIFATAGFHLFEIPGFIIGLSLGAFSSYSVATQILRTRGMAVWVKDFGITIPAAGIAVLGYFGPAWVAEQLGMQDLRIPALVSGVVLMLPVAGWAFLQVLPYLQKRRGRTA